MKSIEAIISSLRVAMTDARQNESHFESWMILNEAICDAIDALAEQKSGINQVIELYDSPHQPSQQEPVVWMYVNKSTHETKFQKHMRDFVDHGLWAEVPLYGEPLANQELNCVCGAVWQGDELVHLPRKPASKPWVGLTDEEISKMPAWIYSPDQDGMTAEEGLEVFARAIEAKLKEKNT